MQTNESHFKNKRKSGLKKYQPIGCGMVSSSTELGSFIRARRLELGLRQTVLNGMIPGAGGTNQLISRIEIGKRKFLNPDQLAAIANALQVDVNELRERMPTKHIAQAQTELGKFICSRREELGLSLEALAERMRITYKKAKALEISKSSTIRYKRAQLLAKALEIDLSVLGPFMGYARKDTGSNLGQLVRTRRKELGMSAAALAEKLDVTYQYVSYIESGRCHMSESDERVTQLARVLKLEIGQLKSVRLKRRIYRIRTATPLGKFLVEERVRLGLSQKEAAQRIGISSTIISRLEKRERRPNLQLLNKITEALGIQIPPELIPVPMRDPRDHNKTHESIMYVGSRML